METQYEYTSNQVETTSGTTGGILGVVFAHIFGIVTFGSVLECMLTAGIGAVVGFVVVKFLRFIEKKYFRKK